MICSLECDASDTEVTIITYVNGTKVSSMHNNGAYVGRNTSAAGGRIFV